MADFITIETPDYTILIIDSIDNPLIDNIDTEVRLKTGEIYYPPFITTGYIKEEMQVLKDAQEDTKGIYFWWVDMVIVREITLDVIKFTIQHLYERGRLPYVSVTKGHIDDL